MSVSLQELERRGALLQMDKIGIEYIDLYAAQLYAIYIQNKRKR